MPAPSLVIQTTYAELLERCAATAFGDAFSDDGAFTSKIVGGRRYWYFQARTEDGRSQKYVGPETPELLKRIEHHQQTRDDERERRALVSTLVRSFGLPRPMPEIGRLVAALTAAGVFRLRGVLVGTLAYQSYSAMLGVKLASALLQTSDVDVAQSKNVSIALGDQTLPMLEVLQGVDKTFREIPKLSQHHGATSYAAKGGLRVDFLTPNEGPDTDTPQRLHALQTNAQPLRFLDFLIHEATPAVVLHDAGIYVQSPSPERFAVHKLILSRRRPKGDGKRDKDLQQAESLFEVLAEKRAGELRSAWEEAHARGRKWRELLLEGMVDLAPSCRDLTLKIVGQVRKILPAMDLTFNNPPVRYNSHRDVATFAGQALGADVECAVSREALEDHFAADDLDTKGRVDVVLKNRSKIERLLRVKYLEWPVEETESVLLKTTDVTQLQRAKSTRG